MALFLLYCQLQSTTLWEVLFLVAYILILFASAIVRDFVIAPYVAHHIRGMGALLVEPLWKVLFSTSISGISDYS